jgi:predicted HicB family RNase H-like nuclease
MEKGKDMPRFTLRLTTAEHEAVEDYARKWKISVNDAIREAIRKLHMEGDSFHTN